MPVALKRHHLSVIITSVALLALEPRASRVLRAPSERDCCQSGYLTSMSVARKRHHSSVIVTSITLLAPVPVACVKDSSDVVASTARLAPCRWHIKAPTTLSEWLALGRASSCRNSARSRLKPGAAIWFASPQSNRPTHASMESGR
ncbi:Hypothetical predicted protein [Octopus vulgaris]|uniref:Secreted protein n=1 Tax=Octopus vulgaris TaxID=6645 RepID=A0AA36BI72_OCTVU|nr:Hypothetical predicted protein [Octopus vulgaris]